MRSTGQLSFSDLEQSHKKKVTRRERFLAQIERLLPWSALVALIEPHYPKAGRRGEQPLPLESMLRVHIAQIAYNYSDPGMEDALYEIASLRQFCRFELDRIPDESAILRFRHLLERHDLAQQIFGTVNQQLAAQNLFLRQGTIVDASLIAAPSSTKNVEGERDLEMHSSKKGNQWYFGAKLHVGVDMETGLMHTVKLTSGHVADITETANLLCGEETVVLGDAGYQGLDKRPEMQTAATAKVKAIVAPRPGKLQQLKAATHCAISQQLLKLHRNVARTRAKVEHVFLDMKVRFGYAKVRYRGLMKNQNRFLCLAALSNVLRGEAYLRRHGIGAS